MKFSLTPFSDKYEKDLLKELTDMVADGKEDFEIALKDAVESKKVCMIEVMVDRLENVLPMVPNGHALNEMTLLGDE